MTSTTRTVTWLLAAVLSLTLLSACGTGENGDAASARLGVAETKLLDFSGTTLEGSDLDATSLKGQPSVFWFWAPWCTVCRSEAPGVERVAAALGDNVEFVGVPGRGEVPAMKQFVTQTGTTSLAHVIDDDGALWKRFGVTSQPSFVFVSASGDVTAVRGAMKESDLRRTVADLARS